jgi:hypothetical protein
VHYRVCTKDTGVPRRSRRTESVLEDLDVSPCFVSSSDVQLKGGRLYVTKNQQVYHNSVLGNRNVWIHSEFPQIHTWVLSSWHLSTHIILQYWVCTNLTWVLRCDVERSDSTTTTSELRVKGAHTATRQAERERGTRLCTTVLTAARRPGGPPARLGGQQAREGETKKNSSLAALA